jgi:hypothetical protein
MSKRTVALIVAALTIGVLAVPVTANAAQFNTSSTIAIASTGKAFTGNVNSPATKCKNARHVTLKRKNQGGTSFVNIGSANTNTAGKWTISTNPVASAQYIVAVAKKTVGADTCKAGTSPITTAKSSSSTIVQGAGNFNGKVSSSNSQCVGPNRKVNLQRKTIYQAAFSTIGSDLTATNGAWRVNTAIVSGASYRGQVVAKQIGNISCMQAFSPVKVAS